MSKNPDPREAREAYYQEAGSWAADRQDALRASRRSAWIIASIAVVIALFEAVALVVLTPLKTIEPYTLLVDRNTGFIQALKPLDAQKIAPDAALTQSFLVQYVIARESFDVDALQANYRKVVLWSVDPARSDYIGSVQFSNPGSPLARYPRSTVIETRVKSVSPLSANAALVRFDTQRRDAGGRPLPLRSWVAVVRYRFSTEPMQQSDRFLNPLGFQVVQYRRDQEQLAPADQSALSAAGAPGQIDARVAPSSGEAPLAGQPFPNTAYRNSPPSGMPPQGAVPPLTPPAYLRQRPPSRSSETNEVQL